MSWTERLTTEKAINMHEFALNVGCRQRTCYRSHKYIVSNNWINFFHCFCTSMNFSHWPYASNRILAFSWLRNKIERGRRNEKNMVITTTDVRESNKYFVCFVCFNFQMYTVFFILVSFCVNLLSVCTGGRIPSTACVLLECNVNSKLLINACYCCLIDFYKKSTHMLRNFFFSFPFLYSIAC